jgi:hypothetical protein
MFVMLYAAVLLIDIVVLLFNIAAILNCCSTFFLILENTLVACETRRTLPVSPLPCSVSYPVVVAGGVPLPLVDQNHTPPIAFSLVVMACLGGKFLWWQVAVLFSFSIHSMG